MLNLEGNQTLGDREWFVVGNRQRSTYIGRFHVGTETRCLYRDRMAIAYVVGKEGTTKGLAVV